MQNFKNEEEMLKYYSKMFGPIKRYFFDEVNKNLKALQILKNEEKGMTEFDYEVTVTINGRICTFYCIYEDASVSDELLYL